MEKQYKEIFGKKTKGKTIYLGVDEKIALSNMEECQFKEKLKLTSDAFVITTILFASPIKGLDILLEAIAELKSEQIVCLIIGMDEQSPYTIEMHKLSAKLGIENQLRWVGVTDNVFPYLSVSDLFVQPSRTEALSLGAVEALSMNVPVVGSNVGGLPEVATELFETGNSLALSKCLQKSISSKTHYENLKKKAMLSFDKKFNMNVSIDSYAKEYEKA